MTSTTFAETATATADQLVITGWIPGPRPSAVYRYLTEADLITTWWSPHTESVPEVGGVLIARWPAEGWTMRGTYTTLDPPHLVGFTWSWDHEPDVGERRVTIELTRESDATLLTLHHGPFSPDEAEDRESHLHGWLHFLPKLAEQFDGITT